MPFSDFITDEDLEDLPENPELAFRQLVVSAEKRLETLEEPSQFRDGPPLEDVRYDFLSIVMGLSAKYDLDVFGDLQLPPKQDFSNEIFFNFKSLLNSSLAKFSVSKASQSRTESLFVSEDAKAKIVTLVGQIRQQIVMANLSSSRKEALIKRLDEFEAALGKRRLNYAAIAGLTIAVLGAPGAIWSSSAVVFELFQKVAEVVAEEKAVELENRNRISPPQPKLPSPDEQSSSPGKLLGDQVDDDIPF